MRQKKTQACSVRKIYNYYEKHGYETVVMGASLGINIGRLFGPQRV